MKCESTIIFNMVVVESHHESSKKFCITTILFTIIIFSQYIASRDMRYALIWFFTYLIHIFMNDVALNYN